MKRNELKVGDKVRINLKGMINCEKYFKEEGYIDCKDCPVMKYKNEFRIKNFSFHVRLTTLDGKRSVECPIPSNELEKIPDYKWEDL